MSLFHILNSYHYKKCIFVSMSISIYVNVFTNKISWNASILFSFSAIYSKSPNIKILVFDVFISHNFLFVSVALRILIFAIYTIAKHFANSCESTNRACILLSWKENFSKRRLRATTKSAGIYLHPEFPPFRKKHPIFLEWHIQEMIYNVHTFLVITYHW